MSTPRCYTVEKVCADLDMNRRTFFRLRAKGELPFLEEVRPRLGRKVRFRADLVDRYVEGRWHQPRAFSSHRRSA